MFIRLPLESYGGIGRDFLKFMEDIITAHAQGRGREGNPRAARDREMRRVAVGVAEYPPNPRAADALIDWETPDLGGAHAKRGMPAAGRRG